MDHQNYTVWHQPENPQMFQQYQWKWKPTKKKPNNIFQSQNRQKSRSRFQQAKKKLRFRITPFAPRNTSSFIIRAKKSGGIASLVSPCPLTPAILPTPILSSPSREREVLVDMAKEEWGVDAYGSMNGLIRLRSPPTPHHQTSSDGSCDVDFSRFELIYIPTSSTSRSVSVNDDDLQIAMLEEENFTLKERLFFMERELQDLRTRVHCLENHELPSDSDLCSEKSVGD